jgi:Uma2 family endonuclease
MSAITTRPRPSPTPPSPLRTSEVAPVERRILIRGLSWDLYDRLSDEIGEGQHIRLAFDGRNLEIMTTGVLHEDFKDLLGRLVNNVTTELDIPCNGGGQTTWKRPELARGLESDQCYYFTPEKLAAIAVARARKSNAVADYPNPDLAIEVDISPPELDRAGIYAALQVAEVWRFDGESLAIMHLQPDGQYTAVESSQFLPISPEEVVRWVAKEDATNKSSWERRLRAWIRDDLAPRVKDDKAV